MLIKEWREQLLTNRKEVAVSARYTEGEIYPSVFLSLFMAYLPQGRYSVNSGKWSEAIRVLRDKYGETNLDFFWGFSILERPPALPYSPEVSQWFTSLYMAVGAPGGPIRTEAEGKVWLEFPSDFQEEAKERNIRHLIPGAEVDAALTIKMFAEEITKEGILDP